MSVSRSLLQKFNETEMMFLKENTWSLLIFVKLGKIFLSVFFFWHFAPVEVIIITNKPYSLHHENEWSKVFPFFCHGIFLLTAKIALNYSIHFKYIYFFDDYACYLELPSVKARKNFRDHLILHSNFLPKYYVCKLDLILHKLLSNIYINHLWCL